jgi:hypothetical protein
MTSRPSVSITGTVSSNQSATKRRRPSVGIEHGEGAAVLVGDEAVPTGEGDGVGLLAGGDHASGGEIDRQKYERDLN